MMLRHWIRGTRTALVSRHHELEVGLFLPQYENLSTCSLRFTRGSSITYEKEDATQDDPVETQYRKKSAKDLLDNATSYQDTPVPHDDVWTQGPYPKNSNFKQSQAKFSKRPNIDPGDTSVILFPGQGTQFVGMGKDLLNYPNVQEMYDTASNILGYDLLDVSLNGPNSQLIKTKYQQPAIVVASLAAIEKLREEKPKALESVVGVAGYSVGEITALAFAGSLSFNDAIRLVKVRAEAMLLASELTPSGMMTVMYGPDSRLGFACQVAKEYCQTKGVPDVDCRIASYLYPHCKVIAGNDEALKFIEKNKKEFKLRRLKRLPVSGAFHTDLMRPAAEALKAVLRKLYIETPLVPVHSNYDGKIYKNPDHIKKILPKQIYFPVKWEQTMHILYERNHGMAFPKTYECGPGNSLSGILKMCNGKAWNNSCFNIRA